MKEVEVKKFDLLAIIMANRDDHRQIFEEALIGFDQEAKKLLEQQLDRLRAGKRRDIRVTLPVPVDHTSDYERAIKMVQMSVGDTLVISERDFAQYVMDDWGWREEFLSNSYGSSLASVKFGRNFTGADVYE